MSNTDAIGIIGAGTWGSTIAIHLAKNKNDVVIWNRNQNVVEDINENHRNSRYLARYKPALPENIKATSSLLEVAQSCRIIFIVVSSQHLRSVIKDMSSSLTNDHALVTASKGIEITSHKTMSQVIEEETVVKKVGVLSGPNLSDEILSGFPAATVIASKYDDLIFEIMEIMNSPIMRVYGNRDIIGVEISGAVKNIIALWAGFFDGMGFGNNAKAMLFTRGTAEISRIGESFGADPRTFAGLAGIGDLAATCNSPLSRNHQVGYKLAKGKSMDDILSEMRSTAEGVFTTRAVYNIAVERNIDVPYTKAMYHILYDKKLPSEVLPYLMTRSTKFEF